MFRITRVPSSGRFIQCLAKIKILNQTPNLSNYSKYPAITHTTSMPTDTIEPLL